MEPPGAERHSQEAERVSEQARANQMRYNFRLCGQDAARPNSQDGYVTSSSRARSSCRRLRCKKAAVFGEDGSDRATPGFGASLGSRIVAGDAVSEEHHSPRPLW